jgi:hypothetical protein
MFPLATASSQGMCMTPGPLDVCKTPAPPAPPVPIPYPNIGMCSDGTGSSKVKLMCKNALRKGDKLSKSMGDNPGVVGGVKSSKFMGDVEFKMGHSKLKVEGKEWSHITSMCEHNGGNTVGMHTVPCH